MRSHNLFSGAIAAIVMPVVAFVLALVLYLVVSNGPDANDVLGSIFLTLGMAGLLLYSAIAAFIIIAANVVFWLQFMHKVERCEGIFILFFYGPAGFGSWLPWQA